MKYYNYIKSGLLITIFALTGSLFTACEDDIDVGSNDGSIYDNVDGVYGYVKSVTGARELSTITFFGNKPGKAQVYFELSEAAPEAVTVNFKVDKTVLDEYNAANGTSYTLYPESSVSFGNGGTASIAANETQSAAVEVNINASGSVGQTYALPIAAEVKSGGINLSKNSQNYIFLVKPYAAIPDSDKGTGVKSILYIEVNDENILNAGEYTMAGSGKPFFDVVNIFAANINYNADTKRAYVNCNENVSYVLKNADLFIRPLQAKGIKVCLTILGNHDEAGVANLSPEASADFARELKNYVDVYGLDGIDFDDEYSKYNATNPSPGLEAPSGKASARLVYECRQLMPDKIISFYDYTNYLPTGTVEGIDAGDLVDYSYWGAYANWRDSRYSIITGMDKSQYGPSSFNLDYSAGNGGYDLSHVERLRPEGWGILMFYNLKPRNYDYSTQFNQIGNVLFDDDVEWTGKIYDKTSVTGTINKPSYDSYLGTWTLKPDRGLFWYTPGPWWDWSDNVEFTLRFEEYESGKSYKVYGWGAEREQLPLIMNYNKYGWIEISLPQTVKEEVEDGKEWTWIPFTDYNVHSARSILTPISPAFQGVISNNGSFVIRALKAEFRSFVTMSAVADITTVGFYETKGGVRQDVAYAPYTLTK